MLAILASMGMKDMIVRHLAAAVTMIVIDGVRIIICEGTLTRR